MKTVFQDNDEDTLSLESDGKTLLLSARNEIEDIEVALVFSAREARALALELFRLAQEISP